MSNSVYSHSIQRVLFSALVAMGLILPTPSGATIVKNASLGDLAGSSQLVVDVTVLSTKAYTRRSPTDIYTATVFKVNYVFKGRLNNKRLRFNQFGGIVGRVGRKITGQPRFRFGLRYILFIHQAKNGPLVVNGLKLGCFHVYQDKQTKLMMVEQNIDGLVIYDPSHAKNQRHTLRGILPKPVAHSDFAARISTLVTAHKKTGGSQ